MSKSGTSLVSVRELHKEFILPQSKNSSFKQTVVNIVKKNNKVTQKVLDGVSFEVNKGDFFGIVGRNGSGKSTLLKLLAGVYVPTSGTVSLNGKLTPFIELGVGFNPELSGRDNVFLNGALLGFNRKQMLSMYDEIVAFAELEPFMEQKLKNYSSGMQVRLAFSIAIKAKNEILIFDEVLAVGDEAFQRKCLDVFEQYKAEGQTVILVTHDMETVRKYCNRAVLIHQGKVLNIGEPRKIASEYSRLNQEEIDKSVGESNSTAASEISVKLGAGKPKVSYAVHDTLRLTVDWSGIDNVHSVGVNIFKQSGEHVTGSNSLVDGVSVQGKTSTDLDMKLSIQPGKYYVLAEVFREVGVCIGSTGASSPHFTVVMSDIDWSGLVQLPHEWGCR